MRKSLLLIGSAAVLAACTSKEGSSAAGGTGGTMIVDWGGDPGSLFPPYVTDQGGRYLTDLVYDRLADLGANAVTIGDSGFRPNLAQKWTWAPDSLSIAFSLDPRARWHDGKPLTASDVRYSFKTFTDPKVGSPVAQLMSNIDSVSVRDSVTAVAWFKRHTPEQFYDLAFQLQIMPEHVFGGIPAEQLRTSDATRKMVGTGRFRLVKWDPGRVEMIADTANFRGRAKLDRVIFNKIDPPAAATQVLTGQADFMEAYPIDQVGKLDSSTVAGPIVRQTRAYTFLAMNPRDPKSKNAPHPIFSDLRVRRALSMAVDRDAMLRNVFGNKGRIGHGPFPMSVGFADSTLRLPVFDTTAAKAMLDSSGWRVGPDGVRAKNGRPLKFALVVPTASLPRRQYGVLLQEQLRKIGAQVDLDLVDTQTMMLRSGDGSFDALLASFNTDPSVSGEGQFWSTAGIGPTGMNSLRYSSPKVDALLDSAAKSFDAPKAKGYASRAFQLIVDDAPAIWLYDVIVVQAVNRRFTVPPMTGDGWWMNLSDWSIPAEKRIDRDRIGLASAKP